MATLVHRPPQSTGSRDVQEMTSHIAPVCRLHVRSPRRRRHLVPVLGGPEVEQRVRWGRVQSSWWSWGRRRRGWVGQVPPTCQPAGLVDQGIEIRRGLVVDSRRCWVSTARRNAGTAHAHWRRPANTPGSRPQWRHRLMLCLPRPRLCNVAMETTPVTTCCCNSSLKHNGYRTSDKAQRAQTSGKAKILTKNDPEFESGTAGSLPKCCWFITLLESVLSLSVVKISRWLWEISGVGSGKVTRSPYLGPDHHRFFRLVGLIIRPSFSEISWLLLQ